MILKNIAIQLLHGERFFLLLLIEVDGYYRPRKFAKSSVSQYFGSLRVQKLIMIESPPK